MNSSNFVDFMFSMGSIENELVARDLFSVTLGMIEENVAGQLEAARAKLKLWSEAYYNLEPLVSDEEYDALREWVKKHAPDAPEIVAVGAPAPTHSVWTKVQHKIPMGSLDKVNTEKEFDEWVKKTGANEFFVTHKIDGSSMELCYENGLLVQCVTRGDGIIGEDVTANVIQVPSIPKKIDDKGNVTVRGEIVMHKEVFSRLYAEEYANPRNTAAGKVREKKKGGVDCMNLEFLAYRLHCQESPRTMFSMFTMLKLQGFRVPDFLVGDADAIKFRYEATNKSRDGVPYEIDGMVVSVNDMQLLEELGDLNMRPRGQTAWKFESMKGVTRVENVVWQVGPSGRVTPVAKVEPVEVGGVTITSISLHNLNIFRELKLWPGCRVLISRRNDVIPYIEKNLDLEEAA
jgi:DNA ligase (NAD+)